MKFRSNRMKLRNRRVIPLRRKIIYSTIVALILAGVLECASFVVMRVAYGKRLPANFKAHEYDSTLGWKNRPSCQILNRYGDGAHATHNSEGARGKLDYTTKIPQDRFRIVFLGDSFTYGICGDEDTYPAQIEQLCPQVQSINLGVAGYGVDQMYLLNIRDGIQFDTNMLVLAFIEDDFDRISSSVFLTTNPKPRLKLKDDQSLIVANHPVPDWGDSSRHGWIGRFPWSTSTFRLINSALDKLADDSQETAIAEKIFDELGRSADRAGRQFVILYLPSSFRGANDLEGGPTSDRIRWLSEYTQKHDRLFVNITDRFAALSEDQRDKSFLADGHYSAFGNGIVAGEFLRIMREKVPQFPQQGQVAN